MEGNKPTSVVESQTQPELIEDVSPLIVDPDNPVLKMFGREVNNDNYSEAAECFKKMKQVISDTECYGVAAQQVGYDLTMFMFKDGHEVVTCVNPSIRLIKPTKYSVWSLEGCLSIPNVIYGVKRCSVLRMTYRDITGKLKEKRYKNLPAIIIQHEYDHIHGRLISDVGYEYDEKQGGLVHETGRRVAGGQQLHPPATGI